MDKILRERLIKHFDAEIRQHNCGDKVYLISGGEKYTYFDIVSELIKETPFAESLASDLIAATCYRLDRDRSDRVFERAKEGETYYYINEFLEVCSFTEQNSEIDDKYYASGNYFKEYSDAITAKNIIQLFIK